MGLLLDLGYLLILVISAPWLIYRRYVAGEHLGLLSRLGSDWGPRVARSIWLHGSSVGEISLLGPLVAMLEQELPDQPLVISAYSPTGYAAARSAYPRHTVIFFPLDFSFIVARFLDHFDPRLIVIIESEFWPNFLRAAARRGVPVAVLNGRMSEKSYRLHARTLIVPRLIRRFPLIAVQSEEHAARLYALGVTREQLRVTGNMKYDLTEAMEDAGAARRELRQRFGFVDADAVIIGGSLHEAEDQALIAAFAEISEPARALVIVPRYPADASRVEAHAQALGFATVRKSALDAGAAERPGRDALLIVDTVGELRRLYAVADIAFVGGSLFFRASNKGGHNLMEPAILGLPVVFGPYNYSFRETALDLVAAGAGAVVHDEAQLAATLRTLVADAALRRRMGESAREVVLRGQGATRRNYALLRALIERQGRALPVSPVPPHNAARD